MSLKRALSILVGVVLVASGLSAWPVTAQDERLVLAFYYAWFDWNTWSLPLSDQPVNPYLSADVVTIARHAEQARRAGIDALVQAWYGPNVTNNQTEPNFWLLLDQAHAHGIKAAVSIDMGDSRFLRSSEAVVEALNDLRARHTQHGGYLRVGGRPVIFFWKEEIFSVPAWEAIRMQVDPDRQTIWIAEGARPEYLEVFDGLYLYSVAWTDDPAPVLIRWGDVVRSWSAEHGLARYWVATVMPGYDDRATGRADAFVRPRDEGEFYRASWQGAIQSQADWVVITSFNEWLEGTQIEPATGYGDTYLNLTSELAATYRSVSFGPTETPEPTSTLEPPTATPAPATATPVVTPTATVTPIFTPTATITPTATPFRLATPTTTPPPSPLPPTANFPPPPTVLPYPTPYPTSPIQRLPVESVPPRRCSFLPLLLPLGALFLAYSKR